MHIHYTDFFGTNEGYISSEFGNDMNHFEEKQS